MPKNCYIHIPFCNNICSYCDFCKIYYDKKYLNKYLDSLEKEIDKIYQGEILDTIYIGGGTPSCLELEELEKLLSIIDKLNKSKNTEYTIEGNFESTTKEKLLLYKKHGINRLSFGLESINKDNLLFLERKLNPKEVKQIITLAKSLGFNNINIDLIYAIPNESLKVLEEDLNFILNLDIKHISTYSLIIEKHTKLSINNVENIKEDLDYKMYEFICNKLNNNKYNHYEISNFSKENYSSRHNLCYWNNNEYYGFGLGASSYLNDKRITNTKSITKYIDNKYIFETEQLTLKDKIIYEIILNLRKKEGIDLKLFKDKYHTELINLYNYQNLIKNKLLIEKDNYLFIEEDKWYISNEIIVELLGSEVNE